MITKGLTPENGAEVFAIMKSASRGAAPQSHPQPPEGRSRGDPGAGEGGSVAA
jgi:hypothetical protein